MFGVAACVRKTCMQLVMAAPDVVKSCLTGLVGLLAGPAKVCILHNHSFVVGVWRWSLCSILNYAVSGNF